VIWNEPLRAVEVSRKWPAFGPPSPRHRQRRLGRVVGHLLGEHQVPGSIALTYRAHAFVRLTAEALVANLSALNTTAAASVSVRA
jgi:hypothetical protein